MISQEICLLKLVDSRVFPRVNVQAAIENDIDTIEPYELNHPKEAALQMVERETYIMHEYK